MAKSRPVTKKTHQRTISHKGAPVNKPGAPFGKATQLVPGKKNFSTLKRTK